VNGHKIVVEFRRLNDRLGARLAGERHQCGDQLSRSASEAGGVYLSGLMKSGLPT
jgi:hypothetical protein